MDILPDPSSIAGDIAVIGLSCRFPGASNCAEFWHLLQAGKSKACPLSAAFQVGLTIVL